MVLDRNQEWWLRHIADEPDCPITAGVPDERDILRECQILAAIGIEATGDKGPLADLFVEIHRLAVSALMSPEPPKNEAGGQHD